LSRNLDKNFLIRKTTHITAGDKTTKKTAAIFALMLAILLSLGVARLVVIADDLGFSREVIVRITSPIQNQTYYSNDVPLNFTLYTNLDASDTYCAVVVSNLDGKLGYRGGRGTRIGEYYPPFSSSYSTTMNVPDGNHLLWVEVWLYTIDSDVGGIGYPMSNLSQIVNFTVSAGTLLPSESPTSAPPSESPTSTEEPFSWLPIAAVSVASIILVTVALLVYFKKRKH